MGMLLLIHITATRYFQSKYLNFQITKLCFHVDWLHFFLQNALVERTWSQSTGPFSQVKQATTMFSSSNMSTTSNSSLFSYDDISIILQQLGFEEFLNVNAIKELSLVSFQNAMIVRSHITRYITCTTPCCLSNLEFSKIYLCDFWTITFTRQFFLLTNRFIITFSSN